MGSSSPFIGEIEPIVESDDELRAILERAELPPLLPALAYLTGDFSLLRDELRPDPLLYSLPGAGFSPDQEAAIRALALEALIRFRDGGCQPAPMPAEEPMMTALFFQSRDGLRAGSYWT